MYCVKLLKKNFKKNKFSYNIVVVLKLKKNSRNNKILEVLGTYDSKLHRINLNIWHLILWISKGVDLKISNKFFLKIFIKLLFTETSLKKKC